MERDRPLQVGKVGWRMGADGVWRRDTACDKCLARCMKGLALILSCCFFSLDTILQPRETTNHEPCGASSRIDPSAHAASALLARAQGGRTLVPNGFRAGSRYTLLEPQNARLFLENWSSLERLS